MKEKGAILLSSLIVMITLTVLVGAFLGMIAVQFKARGEEVSSFQALWLAEAGLQKAIWYLKTPPRLRGQGEDWTTTGTTESLGLGTYTLVVERWDFALATNGASAQASSSRQGQGPELAIDGNNATFWESSGVPSAQSPEFITITFPYALTLNKVRFLANNRDTRPRDYQWQVSSDNLTYTTVVTVTRNITLARIDTFVAVSNVKYLRLRVTLTGAGSTRVRIATLEAIGSKITSTGTVNSIPRKIEQTVVADDGSPQNQVAYDQVDWTEIIPA